MDAVSFLSIAVIALLVATIVVLVVALRRRRADAEALERALSVFHTTLDAVVEGVLVVRRDGTVETFNQQFVEMWRIPRAVAEKREDAVLIQQCLEQLKTPEVWLARVHQVYSRPDEHTNAESFEFKDGRVFERHSRPRYSGSKVTGRVWCFRDVTDRIRAEEARQRLAEKLAQAGKMEALGTLAGGVAHDFNNILTGVLGYTDLAQGRLEENHPAREELAQVLRAAERARDLVRQILTFSRKREPEKHLISIEPIVRDTLKLLRATTPAPIEIRSDLRPGVGDIFADSTQMHQAVLNIGTNAVHAIGDAAGVLCFSLNEIAGSPENAAANPKLATGRWVRLSISDTGQGMNEQTLERVFEPFYTTKPGMEGTGIGLAVVQAIVEAHGGVILVQSRPGQGTVFHLHFPRVGDARVSISTPVISPPSGRSEHILVVDDESLVSSITVAFLTRLGYRATACPSPEEALSMFEADNDSYAMVISDLNMPRMNGIELIRRIRRIAPKVPCLLCTGVVGSVAEESEAEAAGVLEIIPKPFTREGLGSAVNRWLHRN
jgi:signal transduction histidine kinase/CheY-like chemotaxis protein